MIGWDLFKKNYKRGEWGERLGRATEVIEDRAVSTRQVLAEKGGAREKRHEVAKNVGGTNVNEQGGGEWVGLGLREETDLGREKVIINGSLLGREKILIKILTGWS